MSQAPYATTKLAHHPGVLDRIGRGNSVAPLLVQWMPTNVCNQACEFCSYGSGPEKVRAGIENPPRSAWKNAGADPRAMMPREKAIETARALVRMGVRAVELTGGGEPLAYPAMGEILAEFAGQEIETALVTNGTLLDADLAAALGRTRFAWARVSIDAGSEAQYVATRHCSPTHWRKAWRAVELLRSTGRVAGHPEFRLGVGYVVDRENGGGIYDAVRLAREAGADNVRISVSFTPDETLRWSDDMLLAAIDSAEQAIADFGRDGFTVSNLLPERVGNVVAGRQAYPFCVWKEVGCVIGADANVYACCSWAYHPAGKIGSIAEVPFDEFWFGAEARAWRGMHDPRRDCRIHCLYERRNLDYLRMLSDPLFAAAARGDVPPHVNFV